MDARTWLFVLFSFVFFFSHDIFSSGATKPASPPPLIPTESATLDANLEEVESEESREGLFQEWKEVARAKYFSDLEFAERVSQRGWRFVTFKSVFEPIKKDGKVFAKRVRVDALFQRDSKAQGSDPKSAERARFKVKDCQDFAKQYSQFIPKISKGAGEFEIHLAPKVFFFRGKNIFSGIELDCLARQEESDDSFSCPNYEETDLNFMGKFGSLITYEKLTDGGAACGPPYHSSEVIAIDLKTGSAAKITDYFKEKSLFNGLKNDRAFLKSLFADPSKSTNKGDPLEEEKEIRTKVQRARSLSELVALADLAGFGIFEPKLRNGKIRIRWAVSKATCDRCPPVFDWLGLDVELTNRMQKEMSGLSFHQEVFLKGSSQTWKVGP